MVVADIAIKVALEGTAGMILSVIIVMAAINGVRECQLSLATLRLKGSQ
mgnify:CR=1 FL=1